MYSSGIIKDTVTFVDSQQMTYLQAVIKEALRMHPATGLPLSRVVPRGGATISGQFFPEGVSAFLGWMDLMVNVKLQTIVGVNSWVAHYNKHVFGDDADEFSPERWLVSKEAEQSLDRYWMPASTLIYLYNLSRS